MKKVSYSSSAQERARAALDEVETAFGVKTGLKAGADGGQGNHYGWSQPNNPVEPPVQALYGVVIADPITIA